MPTNYLILLAFLLSFSAPSVVLSQINKNNTSLPTQILPGNFQEISVYNNDTLYAGKIDSGLFRTTEGPFAEWEEISIEGVTKVTVNENNPSNIFLCAGTSGLFESTDFGETWNDISSGLQLSGWEFVTDLIIDTKNTQHLFCTTSGIDNRDLYESTDGGDTWQHKNLGSIVTKLKYIPGTDTLFMAYESVLLMSIDNGESWTTISTFEYFIGDFVFPENHSNKIFVALENGGVYLSTDLGQNWESRINGIEGNQIRQLIVSRRKPTKLYSLVDYNKIYYTTNSGENWQLFYITDDMAINKIALSTDEQYLYAATDDGLYLFNLPVGVEEETDANSSMFSLSQNYPNPFNPTTTINYTIPVVETRHALSLQLIIYDILGRKVTTLVNKKQTPGKYSVQFDGSKFGSGIYFYRLQAGKYSQTRKMILMK